MLLYWGLFTVGFTVGAVFSFITFAAKRPEEEGNQGDQGLLGTNENLGSPSSTIINPYHP